MWAGCSASLRGRRCPDGRPLTLIWEARIHVGCRGLGDGSRVAEGADREIATLMVTDPLRPRPRSHRGMGGGGRHGSDPGKDPGTPA